MAGVIDADTHISESESMWQMLDPGMHHRRPVVVSVPNDTLQDTRCVLADRWQHLSQACWQRKLPPDYPIRSDQRDRP